MKKWWPFLAVIIVIVVIAAFALNNKNSNNNSTTPAPAPAPVSNPAQNASNSANTATPTPAPEASTSSSVSIANMSYSPSSLTVKKGTTVTWTNNDDVAHTVTADSGNAFDSGNMDKGKNFSHTFDTAGTFAYHCTYHSNMHGKVIVTD
jgi:plastocyanin